MLFVLANRQKATASKGGFVYLRIPKCLTASSKVRKFSMGVHFGTSLRWHNFVASYVRYALCNVDSFYSLQQWCKHELDNFRSRLQKLYVMYKGEEYKCLDFWEIRPSRIPTDERFVADGSFKNTCTGRGAGLFCTETGKDEIPFDGVPAGITEHVHKGKARVSKLGGFYQVEVGGPFVEVPTDASFAAKAIPIGFIVNHRVTDPTHFLTTSKGKASLKPFRAAQKEEEFCFNYRYELSDDVPTQEE